MTAPNPIPQALYQALRNRKPFSSLSDPQYSHLMSSAQMQVAAPGEVLIRQGDNDRDLLVLLTGELEVRRTYENTRGVRELDVGRLLPGEMAGEFALLMGISHQATVHAISASQLLRVDGELMEELLAWSQCFVGELSDVAKVRARMNLVRETGPFRSLPLERVMEAFGRMKAVDMDVGTDVVRQGDEGDSYYIIEQGQVEVWQTDPLTDKSSCVAKRGPGEAFGEEALLLGGYRNATVTMATAGRLLVLHKDDFDQMVKPFMLVEVQAEKARTMIEALQARPLDCRYDFEFKESHLPDALHMPLDSLRERLTALDPDQEYIVYCRSGRRSAAAAFLLQERGFRAYSLVGGVRDWPYALAGK